MPEQQERPRPLPQNSMEFELFQIACAMKEMVRIDYLVPVPDDPDLTEDVRNYGIPTVEEGHALAISQNSITFVTNRMEPESSSPNAMQKVKQRVLPRMRVMKIRRIGAGSPVFEFRG